MKRYVIPILALIIISSYVPFVSAYSMSWLHRELYFNNNTSMYAGGITVNWYAHDGYAIGMTGAASFDITYHASSKDYRVILENVTFVLCESNYAPYENGTLPSNHVYTKASSALNINLTDVTYRSERFILRIPDNLSISSADLHIILQIRVYYLNTYWTTLIVSRSVERNIVSISPVPNLYDALVYFIDVIIALGISGLILAGIALVISNKRMERKA